MQQTRAIYIHIPFCKSRCYYCTFLSSCDYLIENQYIDALVKQIADSATQQYTITSIYIGGGTPSTLQRDNITRVFDTIRKHYLLDVHCEITVECNPDSVDSELVQTLVNCGVNRVSLGVQSMYDDTLKSIGRLHNRAIVDRAISLIASGGININVDIMIGLPETTESFCNTVDILASNQHIQHISMYALELYPDSTLSNAIMCGRCRGVPDTDSQADMYDIAFDTLIDKGYVRYEVSNFARQGYQCRHNINYWECGQYYGFGLGASGYLDDERYCNTSSFEQYFEGHYIDTDSVEHLDQSDKQQEYVLLGLRLDSGVSLERFRQLFGCQLLDVFPNCNQLLARGVLTVEGDRLRVGKQFTYVLNSILVDLLS